jgi:hypothetical protein
MDPVATLQMLDDSVDSGLWHQAVEALDAYYQWRLKGGFEPVMDGTRGDLFASNRADELAEQLAQLA